MGTASMFGTHTFDVEVDSDWMTADLHVTFSNHSDEGLIELESVKMVHGGHDVTNQVNQDYFFDLIEEYLSNADYHVSDHGN